MNVNGADIVIGHKHLVRWFGGQVFGSIRNVEQEYEDIALSTALWEDASHNRFRTSMRIVIEVDAVDGSTVLVDSSRVGDIRIIDLTNSSDSVY